MHAAATFERGLGARGIARTDGAFARLTVERARVVGTPSMAPAWALPLAALPRSTMASPTIPFCSIQRVYFDDLDALGLLHNVRYLLFIERARFEMFDAFGFRWGASIAENPDKMHVVAGHEVKYLRPVTELGDLCVALTPSHVGTSSFSVNARVQSMEGSKLYAEVTTRLVRLDLDTKRPCPWSDRFRSAFSRVAEA